MSIQTIYVKAKSKKELNERLANDEQVMGTIHSMGTQEVKLLSHANDGDVIKIYEKFVGGSPYAKAYGNWNSKKGKVV